MKLKNNFQIKITLFSIGFVTLAVWAFRESLAEMNLTNEFIAFPILIALILGLMKDSKIDEESEKDRLVEDIKQKELQEKLKEIDEAIENRKKDIEILEKEKEGLA